MSEHEPRRCDCACLGCKSFHGGGDHAEGQDAHHTRLLLALDLSIQAACKGRGIAACDGLDGDEPCEVGTLHTQAAALAQAMAAAIEDPSTSLVVRVKDALGGLLAELAVATAGKPRVS